MIEMILVEREYSTYHRWNIEMKPQHHAERCADFETTPLTDTNLWALACMSLTQHELTTTHQVEGNMLPPSERLLSRDWTFLPPTGLDRAPVYY